MSNYWRKIGLSLVTLLLTTSCNIESDREIANKESESLQGQILVWAEMPFKLTEAQSIKNQKLLQDDLEEFSQLYPQVQVFVEFFPWDKIWEPFELEVKRGAGPDLLLVEANAKIPTLIKTGALKVLDESQVEQSRFRSEALKKVRYQGQLYGLPMRLSTTVLCYNKDRVKEVVTTLPELIEQARQGYSVGVNSGFVQAFWGAGVFGGQLFDAEGRVVISEGGGWAKWIEWLKKAQNEPNFILSDDPEALQEAFVQGNLTYLTCASEWIPHFIETLGKDKLGVTLLPGETNQPATPQLWAGVLLFNQASSSNQTQLALKLAQFLTNVEQQKQIGAEVPFIPSTKNFTVNRHLFPLQATLLEQVQSSVAFSLDDAEKIELFIDEGEILYRKILAGEISSDEAVTQLTQNVNRQFGWRE